MTDIAGEGKGKILIPLMLILITLVLYLRVWDYRFINFDDYPYVVENTRVKAGLTMEGISWAFTTIYAGNWHPLTWLSHMLDCQLFGLNPGPHHIVNLCIHTLSVLLLFLLLRRMTKSPWRSAFVAAVFAIHPLHVESVAWIAERKDVLNGLFWMLTLSAYLHYIERPVSKRYFLVLGFFTLGLMTKPMLVTLPCVMLLLDYWPFCRVQSGILDGGSKSVTASGGHSRKYKKEKRRSTSKSEPMNLPDTASIQPASVKFLIREKVPFLFISVISSAVTIYAQQRGGAISSLQQVSLSDRIANALVSYVQYLGKAGWPQDLAVYYPYSSSLPAWQVIFSAIFLVSVTVAVILAYKRFPYLIVGWLWYLGTLIPVIGIIQVGGQAMADRYTYIPLIGICLMIGWGMPDLIKKWPSQKISLAVVAIVLLLSLAVVTWRQLDHWKDSFSLFRHTIAVTRNNFVAFNNLGTALQIEGNLEEAVEQFREAIRINPAYEDAHSNLALALIAQGKIPEAMTHLTEALAIRPSDPEAHYNMGTFLAGRGDIAGAIDHFHEAIRLRPDYAKAHNNLGSALLIQGRTGEAVGQFEEALRIDAGYETARANLQDALSLIKKHP